MISHFCGKNLEIHPTSHRPCGVAHRVADGREERIMRGDTVLTRSRRVRAAPVQVVSLTLHIVARDPLGHH